MLRYAWLFDQRFESLRSSFEEFLEARDIAGAPINGYDVFPEAVRAPAPGEPAELVQRSPEDVARLFSRRWRAGERWGHDGARPLPVASFTMDGLSAAPGIDAFGVSPAVVRRLSDKALQYQVFYEAGLPVPEFTVVASLDELAQRLPVLLAEYGAVFAQPAYSSGGEQAAVLCTATDIAAYRHQLRAFGADGATLVAARYMPGRRTLSGNGIVTKTGRVVLLGVTELLQDGFRFDGFIFPTFEHAAVETAVNDITLRVGELLRARDYWGFFTADMLRAPDGSLLVTEANTRFSGEAACIAASMECNPFELMAGTVRPPARIVAGLAERIVVTKIRPTQGQVVHPIGGSGDAGFLSGASNTFRVGYHAAPVRVITAHFVGLAGRRLEQAEGRDAALRFYLAARRP